MSIQKNGNARKIRNHQMLFWEWRNYPLKIIYLILFSLIFFGIRIPFFGKGLVYEEGLFSYIFTHDTIAGLVGRISGHNIVNTLSHPSMIYKLMSIIGQIYWSILGIFNKDPFIQLNSVYYRIGFALIQFVIYATLLLLILRKNSRNGWKMAIILLISLLPIAYHTSFVLQVDNSIGFLITGIFAITIAMDPAIDLKHPGWFGYILFIAGMFQGLGKNEWAIIFFIACCCTMIWSWFRKSNTENIKPILLLLSGCLSGSLINYLYDKINYTAGLKLIFDSRLKSYSGIWTFDRWFHQFSIDFEYSFPLLILLICITLLLNNKSRNSILYQLNCIYAWGLFIMCFWSPQVAELRYYSPILPLIVSLLIGIDWESIFINKRKSATAILICLFLVGISTNNLYQSLTINQNRMASYRRDISYWENIRAVQIEAQNRYGCIPVVDPAYGFYTNGDFLSYTDAKNLLKERARSYGKKICTENIHKLILTDDFEHSSSKNE